MNTGKRIIELEDKHQTLQQPLISSRNKIRTVFDALPDEIMQGVFESTVDQPCCILPEVTQSVFYRQVMHEMVKKGFVTQKPQFHLDCFQDENGMDVIKERNSLPVVNEDGKVQTVTVVSRYITDAHQRSEEIMHLPDFLGMEHCGELMTFETKGDRTLFMVNDLLADITCTHGGAFMEQRHQSCLCCGRELIRTCAQCNQFLAADWHHCPTCGVPITHNQGQKESLEPC